MKRGTPIEITERFGNGKEVKTIGYYWRQTKECIELTQSNPPYKIKGKLWEKRFVYKSMIVKIKELLFDE